MRDHRKLEAYSSADDLAFEVYQVTVNFPYEERFGLVHQMRKAAVSVPANIAEGCGRRTEKELIRFLEIAFGSLRELEYFISLVTRLGYCKKDHLDKLVELQSRTARLLCGLIRAYRRY